MKFFWQIFKFLIIIWTVGTWLISTSALIVAKGLLSVNLECSLIWYYLLYLTYYNIIYIFMLFNEDMEWYKRKENYYTRVIEIVGRMISIILNIFVIGGLIVLINEDNEECLNGEGLYDELVILMIEIYCAWYVCIICFYSCIMFLPIPENRREDAFQNL